MESRRSGVSRVARFGLIVGAVVLSVLVVACGGSTATAPSAAPAVPAAGTPVAATAAPAASAAASAAARPTIGAAEKTKLNVGWQVQDVGTGAPFYIASALGYFKDEGLEVTGNRIDKADEALVGGSLDFAIVEPGLAGDLVAKKVPLVAICGWRWSQAMIIGVGKGIATQADLKGKDVVMGLNAGDPAAARRIATLKAQAGWDLNAAGVNFVNPPGSTNQFVDLLIAGKLYLTYLFPRHIAPIQAAGGKIIMNIQDPKMSDTLMTTKAFAAANPNTIAHLDRALIRAKQFFMDPKNAAQVQDIATKAGVTVNDDTKNNWSAEYQTHTTDCTFPEAAMTTALTFANPNAPKLADVIDTKAVTLAQQSLGITVNTTGVPQPLSATPLK